MVVDVVLSREVCVAPVTSNNGICGSALPSGREASMLESILMSIIPRFSLMGVLSDGVVEGVLLTLSALAAALATSLEIASSTPSNPPKIAVTRIKPQTIDN